MSDLRGPAGPVGVRLVERQGNRARFETDVETWDRIHAAGLFHTGGTALERPFEPGRPVEIEAVLDPTTDPRDEDGVDAWWALSVTQVVDLPAELADDGVLREGASFRPPPWSDLARAAEELSGEPLLDLVLATFAAEGWAVERPSEETSVKVVVPPELADVQLWVRTDEVLELVTVYAVLPSLVGRDQVPDMLELAARLNADVPVGSYEADPQTGLLSFKTGIDVQGDRLSEALLRQMVRRALAAAERAEPAVASVLVVPSHRVDRDSTH